MKKIISFLVILFLSGISFGQDNKSCDIDFTISGFVSFFPYPDDLKSMEKEISFVKQKSEFKDFEIKFIRSDKDDLYKESCLLLYDTTSKKYYVCHLVFYKKETAEAKMFQAKVDEIWTYVVFTWAKVNRGTTNTPDFFNIVGAGTYSDSGATVDYYIYSLDNVLINNTPVTNLILRGLNL